ncbi:DUF2207 family protein [Nocardioides sp. AN3]
MTRIASYLAGILAVAGVLCLPALWADTSSVTGEAGPPWSGRWDDVLGTSSVLLVGVLLVGLVGAVLAGRLGALAGERQPSNVVVDAPPEGLGPAQAVHVLGEPITEQAYVGTLLHAASVGTIALRRDDDGWVLSRLPQPEGPVDVVTERAYGRLLETASPFRVSPTSVAAGRVLHAALTGVRREARAWGVQSGAMSRTGVAGGCAALLGLSVLLVAACVVLTPFGMSMLGLLPGMLLVGACSAAAAGAGTRHTRRGRQLWARVGGFKRLLQAPSSRLRFGFSGREELYTAYVPWAVAFGCSKEWAQKYRNEVGTEPPVPAFLEPYDGPHTADHVDAMVSSLQSAVDGAISTWQDNQSAQARPRRR